MSVKREDAANDDMTRTKYDHNSYKFTAEGGTKGELHFCLQHHFVIERSDEISKIFFRE
jgi:hypothetical protein